MADCIKIFTWQGVFTHLASFGWIKTKCFGFPLTHSHHHTQPVVLMMLGLHLPGNQPEPLFTDNFKFLETHLSTCHIFEISGWAMLPFTKPTAAVRVQPSEFEELSTQCIAMLKVQIDLAEKFSQSKVSIQLEWVISVHTENLWNQVGFTCN